MKFLSAYLHGAFSASILYLCVSRLLGSADAMSAPQIALLIYWILVAVLFGVACVAIFRDWPSKQTLRYVALGSLVPAVVLVVGTKLVV